MTGKSGQRLAGDLKKHQTWGQALVTICTVTNSLLFEMKDQTIPVAQIFS